MRINRIDSFRTAAILAVICIHTKPFLVPDSPSLPYKLSGILINQGGRFAVPFFLIISGYLYGCKLTQGVDPVELGKRYSIKNSADFLLLGFRIPFFAGAYGRRPEIRGAAANILECA